MGKKPRTDTRAQTDKRTCLNGPNTLPGECKMWYSDEIISFWHPDRHTHTRQNLYILAMRAVTILLYNKIKLTVTAQTHKMLNLINVRKYIKYDIYANVQNCSYLSVYHCAQLMHSTQHRAVLIASSFLCFRQTSQLSYMLPLSWDLKWLKGAATTSIARSNSLLPCER